MSRNRNLADIGLIALLKKEGGRLGGTTGPNIYQYFLRNMGKESPFFNQI